MELPMQIIQRVCIWFCMHQGDPPSVTLRKLQAVFGAQTYSKTAVCRLHKEYSSGRCKVGDLPRSGRPRTGRTRGNIAVCERAVQRDKRIDIHHLCRILSASYGTVFRILHKDLSLRKKASKHIPHVLTEEQKRHRVSFAVSFLDSYPSPRQLKWIITTDESYFHVYDPDSKVKNMAWLAPGEQRLQVARRSRSTAKIMMVPFFDRQGMIHVEYLHNETVNKKNFKQILQRAWESVRRRRSIMWRGRQRFLLHMDNASPHRGDIVRAALREWGWSVMAHPAYSPISHLVIFFFSLI